MTQHVNQEQLRQHAHYSSVKARLMNPPAAIDKFNAEMSSLRDQLSDMGKEIVDRDAKIRCLEREIAERDAKIAYLADKAYDSEGYGLPKVVRERPISEIVADVLIDHPGVTWGHVIGPRATRHLVKARHLCMVAVYEERKDLTLADLGRIFKRDHSVILHALGKHGKRPGINRQTTGGAR
ncbi:hypothetical protein N182_18495 [Sinorhizobium sp. GL2]|nr:hypothetical protein N182_18495 [Sinorhizobium sp. GL2]